MFSHLEGFLEKAGESGNERADLASLDSASEPCLGFSSRGDTLSQLWRPLSQTCPGSLGVTEHAEPGARALARQGRLRSEQRGLARHLQP